MEYREPLPVSSREGQLRSPFTGILETLCESCHGALAALLVDEEGEAVDLAGVTLVEMDGDDKIVRRMEGFDIKLSGAHWQIVLREAMATQHLGGVRQLWVTTPSHGYIIKSLFEGYVLVFVCRPDAVYTVSSRALRQVEVELALEARWAVPRSDAPFWRRAKVRMDRARKAQPPALRRRPRRQRGAGRRGLALRAKPRSRQRFQRLREGLRRDHRQRRGARHPRSRAHGVLVRGPARRTGPQRGLLLSPKLWITS